MRWDTALGALCVLGSLALAVPAASAQAIDTNRPGFSFSTVTVDKGLWQLETGLDYTRIGSGRSTTSLPAAELRWGVAEQVEVFLSGLNWTDRSTGAGGASGLNDFNVGTKIRVTGRDKVTQMAVLLQVSVPAGEDGFTSDRWDPTAAFVWAHNGAFPIAGTVKVSKFRGGYQLDNGLKLPFSFGERHSVFAEWEANVPENGGNSHWLNGGWQYLLAEQMQLDLNLGLGLNDRAADYRLGIGFSYRF